MMTVPEEGATGSGPSPKKLEDLNPTTRSYPRTLEEAFKDDVRNSEWWFPPRHEHGVLGYLTWLAAISMWIGLAYWYANT